MQITLRTLCVCERVVEVPLTFGHLPSHHRVPYCKVETWSLLDGKGQEDGQRTFVRERVFALDVAATEAEGKPVYWEVFDA